MASQIAPVSARGCDIHESEQRRPESGVTREELHSPVLQRACATAAGRRLAGRDLPPQLTHAQLNVRHRRERRGTGRRHGRSDGRHRVATLWLLTFRHHAHPSGLHSTVVQNARDRISWRREARAGRAPRPRPGRGRAADRPQRRRHLRHRRRDLRRVAGLLPHGDREVPDRPGPRVDGRRSSRWGAASPASRPAIASWARSRSAAACACAAARGGCTSAPAAPRPASSTWTARWRRCCASRPPTRTGWTSRARRWSSRARSPCTRSGGGGWVARACWSWARGRSGSWSRSAPWPRARRRW